MALVLKEGAVFTPAIKAQYGVNLGTNSYYAVIDAFEYNKAEKHCAFSVLIFASRAARLAKTAPTDAMNIRFSELEFNTVLGNDGLTTAKAYAKAAEVMTDWESDE